MGGEERATGRLGSKAAWGGWANDGRGPGGFLCVSTLSTSLSCGTGDALCTATVVLRIHAIKKRHNIQCRPDARGGDGTVVVVYSTFLRKEQPSVRRAW